MERIGVIMDTATTLRRALASIVAAAAVAADEVDADTAADVIDIIVIAIGSCLTGVG